MTAQQQRKQHIRNFMKAHYTDARLAELLAHAQDGRLAYNSCCCFIGVPTANHALETNFNNLPAGVAQNVLHYRAALAFPGATIAEIAFRDLVKVGDHRVFWHQTETFNDRVRRRILVSMIRAEMKRRAALRVSNPTPEKEQVSA